ncbi:MAG: hypothetical protein JWN14_4194, partial [Chthonomonadales bacterium]|nr:hypothetical protein [Chthonomonadales bacterium]
MTPSKIMDRIEDSEISLPPTRTVGAESLEGRRRKPTPPTARRRLFEELRKSEERFRTLATETA